MARPPDKERRPGGNPGAERIAGEADRQGEDSASGWLAGELAAVEDKLRAARLTLTNRGIVPRPAIRSAAVQLVALDAAVSDDVELIRTMPERAAS